MRGVATDRPKPRLAAGWVWLGWLLVVGLAVAAGVPEWGARKSSPLDTPPDKLKPGEWIWFDSPIQGPLAVIVSLTEQRAYVYRNGVLIAVSTISSGRPGYETPTGVFTILQKDRNHRSNKYQDAPMPYQQRLTWDGIALHAGGLPGYPESHGCVHLPTEFARRLFGITELGMTVVVSRAGSAPVSVVHPRAISPIDPQSGSVREAPPLAQDESFRWHPEDAPDGPVSLVMSLADRSLVVYRNGVEIGQSRIVVNRPQPGTHAYIVTQDDEQTTSPGEHRPRWITIGMPGSAEGAGQAVPTDMQGAVTVPEAFLDLLRPLLKPGVVLLVTDAPILPGSSGTPVEVLDAEPPPSP